MPRPMVICSAEFLWGVGLGSAVKALSSMDCDGIFIPTDGAFFPSRLEREDIYTISRAKNRKIIVGTPERDVNISSQNPYVSEASKRAVMEVASFSKMIGSDILVVDPGSTYIEKYAAFVEIRRLIERIKLEGLKICLKIGQLVNSEDDLRFFGDIDVAAELHGPWRSFRKVAVLMFQEEIDDRTLKELKNRSFTGYLVVRPRTFKYDYSGLKRFLPKLMYKIYSTWG
ncbi:MAG: hypothetical protein ACP5KE_03465 [Candidatus Methanodesulfokora sp.]|jgi:hypothetical protein|nr:MAG: hypothetical protein C0200_05545 [Candidatus Korarchaeota archaeon]